MLPNKNIQELEPYLSIPHDIWKMSDCNKILKLDWNEATISPSPKVIEAINNFLLSGKLNWYPNTYNIDLLDSLSQYTKQLDISYIQIFASSDVAHENIIDVFLEKGDKVCIISPTYDNFRARANGIGVETVQFLLNDDFDLDFQRLHSFIKYYKIKFVYLCNPNNPTGICYDVKKIEQIICENPNVMFLIDEAYYEFCKKTVAHLVKNCKNLIITRTFSKAFALASFRIGYIISHYENINHINKLRNSKNVTMLSQVAALAALNDLNYMNQFVDEVNKARSMLYANLNNLDIKIYEDSKANFVLIKTYKMKELCKYLKVNHIYIRDYDHIIPQHCRISIGTEEQMKYLVSKIKVFYEE
ncbi:pyridoxal phosphate-dependent aminotransferase [Campylobacter insulaenigrae]|uniref:pyridoxal phosphate-dependent aminotransferase n=1 Tax=Campylobacter insulaenigrae TaxID=260714 RepID=UPI0021524EE7|nr:histidinol-phosphate transaminase [Campylobacter insulaenigrae]MCR6571464.1 histidinol-phosphate aminotransferase family protein [Campylobacter insulaenigrae]MCR6583829.1 histidinol-phosphate aminotransferase family protein [Campylobacter insulaenigrae]